MKLQARDIHNHLLPGVDDGFRKAEDSLRAIEKMAADGCHEIIFSPHMNPDVYPDESEAHFKEVYDSFAPRIPEEWGVKTSLAAEYMVVNGFEERAANPESLLTWPDGSILIEMSYFFRSRNFESAIFELGLAGLKPIVAHPERYLYMSDSLKDFEKWKDMGCRFQLNFVSLTGKYGKESVRIMKHLFDEDMYDFVSTDLHTVSQLEGILDADPVRKLRKRFNKFLEKHQY